MSNITIANILGRLKFDSNSGKVFRLFKGPDDQNIKEYELPITDSYLHSAFNPDSDWPDFFAEDVEYFYFAIPPLPGEKIVVCKVKKSTSISVPFTAATIRHDDEIIKLAFSKPVVFQAAEVANGSMVVFWREARVAAIADSLDMAVARASVLLVNRLVETSPADGSYGLRSDVLLTHLLSEQQTNVSIHCLEAESDSRYSPALLSDPGTSHTMEDGIDSLLFDPETDPRYN